MHTLNQDTLLKVELTSYRKADSNLDLSFVYFIYFPNVKCSKILYHLFWTVVIFLNMLFFKNGTYGLISVSELIEKVGWNIRKLACSGKSRTYNCYLSKRVYYVLWRIEPRGIKDLTHIKAICWDYRNFVIHYGPSSFFPPHCPHQISSHILPF